MPHSSAKRQVAYVDRPWLASYPPDVPADYDVPRVPLTRLLDDAAASFPTGAALDFLDTTLTYRELRDSVDRFAGGLARLGVAKGDRVALLLPNCPQHVIALFAALRLGAVAVAHNPLSVEAELREQLTDSGAKVVVCLDKTYATVARVVPETAVERVVVTSIADYLPPLRRGLLRLPLPAARARRAELTAPIPRSAPVDQFPDLVRSSPPARQTEVDPVSDIAVLLYTGGTTGRAKGAMLSHHNLVANAYQTRLWLPDAAAGREVTLAVLPLFHAYGLTLCLTTTVLLASRLVLLPRFDLDLVFETIEDRQPTLFPGVPPIYKALVDAPKVRRYDLRSIRACISGAMKLPLETQEQFERITGGRLVEGYGMTETSPATHCNPLTGPRRVGSIGLPLPSTQCKVVDPDDPGREVPPGSPGELAVRGPQVFLGYWRQPEQPGVFTDDGFVLTGDIAVMDDDGFFTIVDRKKELIIAGGFNIYPSEVEEVLLELPGVADAVVIGVPDRYRGETVKAFVVRRPAAAVAEDDVRAHCASRLSAYKVPKLVEFRDELPRTALGKSLRRVLVDEERAKAAAADLEAAPARRPAPGAKDAAPAKKTPAEKATAGKKTTAAKKPAAKKAAAKKSTPPRPPRRPGPEGGSR